jgi:proteasome lid subunit RPN8/RPN11
LDVDPAIAHFGFEVSGLLLGRRLDGNVIEQFVSGDQVSKPYYTRLQTDFLAWVASQVSSGKLGEVVGWFHSHPGIGLFLSSVDEKTLRTLQGFCHEAVAMVIDPLSSARYRFFMIEEKSDEVVPVQVEIVT